MIARRRRKHFRGNQREYFTSSNILAAIQIYLSFVFLTNSLENKLALIIKYETITYLSLSASTYELKSFEIEITIIFYI